MPARKKKDEEETILEVKDGEVVETIVPKKENEVGVEVEGKILKKFKLLSGEEAVYEYVGDCWDCQNKRPPETVALFKCTTHPVRADERLGNQLAAYWREGHEGIALCQNCQAVRLTGINRPTPKVKRVV